MWTCLSESECRSFHFFAMEPCGRVKSMKLAGFRGCLYFTLEAGGCLQTVTSCCGDAGQGEEVYGEFVEARGDACPAVQSATLPPVSGKAMGRQSRSISAWVLVR